MDNLQMLDMMKPMFKGFKIGIDIEVAGKILKTNADHVAGSRVTLLEMDMEALLQDETKLKQVQALGPNASVSEPPYLKDEGSEGERPGRHHRLPLGPLVTCAVTPAPEAKLFLKWVGANASFLPCSARTIRPRSGVPRAVPAWGGVLRPVDERRLAGGPVAERREPLTWVATCVRDAADALIGELDGWPRATPRGPHLLLRGARPAFQPAAGRLGRGERHARGLSVDLAAALLYLNKTGTTASSGSTRRAVTTCRPTHTGRIVHAERIRAAWPPGHACLSITCRPFDRVAGEARPGEFVYFDPPMRRSGRPPTSGIPPAGFGRRQAGCRRSPSVWPDAASRCCSVTRARIRSSDCTGSGRPTPPACASAGWRRGAPSTPGPTAADRSRNCS
jgi:hypothetical protein